MEFVKTTKMPHHTADVYSVTPVEAEALIKNEKIHYCTNALNGVIRDDMRVTRTMQGNFLVEVNEDITYLKLWKGQ